MNLFRRIINLFKNNRSDKWKFDNEEEKGHVSALHYKEHIKALGFGTYQDINIIYLFSMGHYLFQFFYKKEFYEGKGETYQEVQELAREKIDELI